jgi:hypothetical protein
MATSDPLREPPPADGGYAEADAAWRAAFARYLAVARTGANAAALRAAAAAVHAAALQRGRLATAAAAR